VTGCAIALAIEQDKTALGRGIDRILRTIDPAIERRLLLTNVRSNVAMAWAMRG
jgi:hypothetical protein